MHTCIGPHFMTHERLRPLPYEARAFYVGLYTSERVKMNCPGLWSGAIYSMSEGTGFQPVDADKNLSRLIEHDLVEWDSKTCVLRFTEFLDTCDSPNNGNAILRWWRAWNGVKACAVRDAHVATLRKLIDDWCAENNKPLSKDHTEKWDRTFGTLPQKLHQPKVVRRGVQQDLFSDRGTVLEPSQASSSVDNSSSISKNRDLNDSSRYGTIRERFGDQQDPDQDQDLFFSSSGSGSAPGLPGDRDLEQTATSHRPRLALVPPPPDIAAVESLLSEIAKAAGGKFRPAIREGLQNVLCAMIETIAEVHRTPPAIELVGQQLARDPTRVIDVRGDPNTMLSVWLATPGAYLEALAAAHAFERDREERSAMVAESLKTLGWAKDTVH